MQLQEYGGRKFLLAAATLLFASLLVWFAKIADGVYATVVVATVAAYITGNVAQKQQNKQEYQTVAQNNQNLNNVK